MEVNEDTISEYLTARKVRFMIPVYQRNYDWKDEQCKQLWDDILALSENFDENKTHFIGTICTKSVNSHERTIIDGQQRIATISLLVKAIHDVLNDADDKKELDESYLHNTGKGVKEEDSIKLQLNKHDNVVYKKLLSLKKPSKKDFTDMELRSRICINYFYFVEKLGELKVSEIESVWSSFDRLNIIVLEIGDENPQEIFESLNSTGLDLRDVDLLRNYLLMNLDYENQSYIYDNYWSKIEENVGTEMMDKFFVDYLIYTKKSDSLSEVGKSRQHINEKNLYKAFKIYYAEVIQKMGDYTTAEKVEYLMNDLYECSIVYKELIFEDEEKPYKTGEEDPSKISPWIIYSITNLNQCTSARPLLLLILNKLKQGKITPEQSLEMLNGCLSFVFRSKISGYSGLTGQSAGNIIRRIEENTVDSFTIAFWKAITSGSGRYAFPSDELFLNELKNRDVYKVLHANGCRYLLYTLEQHYVNAKGVDDAYPWDASTEHIMPQTLTDSWKSYLGEEDTSKHLEYVHRLGNLAITDYNSDMSNKDYIDKKKWFQTASYAYTSDLVKIDKWDISSIDERGELLANECLKIWTLPLEYQNNSALISQTGRKAKFRFSLIGIEVGDVITFSKDHNVKATVIDDKYVEYNGEKHTLSSLAKKLLNKNNVDGPSYFLYRGRPLNDIRAEIEDDLAFDESQTTLC